jgi:hypothetical protein
VPADPAGLRFFADESILGVGKALAIVRTDLVHPGHPLIPEVPVGTLDPDWMPEVAARGLAVLARDRHIRTRPAELELLRQHELRVFWIAGKKDLSSWAKLTRLMRRWDDIDRTLATKGPGPWFMAIYDFELKEIRL